MRRLVLRIVAGARDAWLIAGITLALFLALEAAYRVQAAARRAIRGGNPDPAAAALSPHHPHANAQWWRDMATGRHAVQGGGIRYDAFRGWWPLPQRSRYMNVDDSGRRVTTQPPRSPEPPRFVYMFGGSTMWGWVVPDSSTIPSRVAAHLHERGYRDVEVVNLSQSMFTLAQNAATLMVELRNGRVPAVAVFFDGNNEAAPPFQSGRVGSVLNESLIARRFEAQGRPGADLMALARRSALVRRLTQGRAATDVTGSAALCPEIAAAYAGEVRSVTALSEAYGFHALFFWQPMLATSAKPRSAWERELPVDSGWQAMIRRCTQLVDSTLAPSIGESYFPLHTLFDADTAAVFTDDYAHLTERASDVVARHIAELVARRLGPPPAELP